MAHPLKPAATQVRSVFISAGHDHSDPGAVGNGYTEADIVLELRDMIADHLRGKIMFDKDGQRGENLPLSEAIGAAKTHDLAIELHCNAFKKPSATGVETLSSPANFTLGAALCQAIAETLHIPNRGAKPEGGGRHSRLGFVSKGGGIIVELFFITNPGDLERYFSARPRLAAAIGDVMIQAATADAYGCSA